MNIYIGDNKKKATKLTKAQALEYILNNFGEVSLQKIDHDDYVYLRKVDKKKAIDIEFRFHEEFELIGVNIWRSEIKTIIDEDNMTRII